MSSRLRPDPVVSGPAGAPLGAASRNQARAQAVIAAAATLNRGDFNALAPVKTLDTRTGLGTPKARLGAGRTITVPIGDRFGVPATGVAGVLMTVTAVAPTAPGYLSVYPAGVARPSTVTLNFATGQTVSNLTLAQLNSAGQVTIFNSGGTVDVTATLSGWYSTTATVHPLTPARLLDTRSGIGGPAQAIALNGTRTIQVTGRGGVPAAGVTAAVVNLTSIGATASGSMALYPTGTAAGVGNLNVPSNAAISNLAIVQLGTGGAISLVNRAGSAHAVVDVQGWISTGGQFHPLSERRFDTRTSPDAPLPTGFFWDFWMTGIGRVPAIGVNAMTMNITIVSPTANGQLVVEPQGIATPAATTISYTKGRTTSTLIQVKVGAGGWIRFDNVGGSVNLILDTVGWYSASGSVGLSVGQDLTLPGVTGSELAGISEDGRYTFFMNLVALAPYADSWSLYARDSVLGITQVLIMGRDAPKRNRVSADGRFAVFESTAPFGAGDTNKAVDVFWYDLITNDFQLVSGLPSGSPGSGLSHAPLVSSSGRYVAFTSTSPGLAPGQTPGLNGFVRDTTAGTTSRLVACPVGEQLTCVWAVTTNGDVIVSADQPAGRALLWRRATGTAGLITQLGLNEIPSSASADGQVEAYPSGLVTIPPDPVAHSGFATRDLTTGAFAFVDHFPDGTPGINAGVTPGPISADGSTVVYTSTGNPTLAPGTQGPTQAYVTDSHGGPITLLSRTATGALGGAGGSKALGVSPTGAYVVWNSRAVGFGSDGSHEVWKLHRVA